MLGLALVAVALGCSNFAAAIGIGLSGVDAKVRLRVAIVFGAFEALTPIIGVLGGRHLAHSLGTTTASVGGGLLMATGVYGLWQARRGSAHGHPAGAHLGTLVLTGGALSIDNLVVGFALGTREVSLAVAAPMIALVSVGMSLVGLELGERLGRLVKTSSEQIGSAVLILVGVAIAFGLI